VVTEKQSAAVRRVRRLAAVRAELDGYAERPVATLQARATAQVAEDSEAGRGFYDYEEQR
jgi:hypothetical protein